MKIKSIASSSKGNAYLISDFQTTVLIECGISLKELKRKTNFIVPGVIDSCLISHEHGHHSKSLKDLLNAGVRCYALKEVFEAKAINNHHRAKRLKHLKQIDIGTFKIITLEMNHDVPWVGFLIYSVVTNEKLLFATDTYMIKYAFHGLDYIMIEANYDIELVEEDAQRKRLIQSHMSIDTTIQYLKSIDLSKVKRIYLMHLSGRHSNEEDFKRRVQAAMGKVVEVCQE